MAGRGEVWEALDVAWDTREPGHVSHRLTDQVVVLRLMDKVALLRDLRIRYPWVCLSDVACRSGPGRVGPGRVSLWISRCEALSLICSNG